MHLVQRHLAAILAITGLTIAGCDGFIVTHKKYDVEALAQTWPAYRAPQVALADLETGQPRDAQPGLRRLPTTDQSQTPLLDELEKTMYLIRPYPAWDLRETAMDSLGRIGQAAVPELVQSLQHPDPVQRQRAAEILARIGPEASGAVPALINSLSDAQDDVRRAAARALGQIGPDAEAAVKPLMRAIEAGDG